MSIPVLGQRFGAARESARRALSALPPGRRAFSLYIHVPFCFHKCHYCDFYSIVDKQDRQGAYTDRLCEELRALAPWAGPLRTVFVGGGTPTLLRPDLWERVLEALRGAYEFAPGHEFTVECNPETATPELMAVLAAGGVNRISIGAQSFNPTHLKTLERWHDPANVARSLELARAAGIVRQSLDLIWGIPGQTLAEWEQDLRTALSLGTSHLSCYSLTYEPGTAMTARLNRGEFAKVDEDLDADMFCLTLDTLRREGMERYEVSNFARPGAECRHNLAYWRQEDWLAAGPSASAHMAGWRWKNTPRLDDWLNFSDGGLAPVVDMEPAEERRNLRERLMTGLRIAEGVEVVDEPRVRRAAERNIERGLLVERGGRWVLTDAGFMVGDTVAAELMAAV
jgi:oxygen-independent coproporphyrinogen-3 oxidase